MQKDASGYNYRKSIEKDSSLLHLTEQEAIKHYIEKKQDKIDRLSNQIDVTLQQRDNARRLLK